MGETLVIEKTTIIIEEKILPRLTLEQEEELQFLRKHHKKLLQFTESETIVSKLDFVEKAGEEFKTGFKTVYKIYHDYLLITANKEIWIKKIDDYFQIVDQLKERMIDEDSYIEHKGQVYNFKEFEKFHKRVSKINKKLQKKYQYRIRESYYDNYMVNGYIKLYNLTQSPIIITLVSYQIAAIVIRQIKRLRLDRFNTDIEDLKQDLMAACISAIAKFDPSKGKPGRESFNYFSHICKKAGYMVTNKESGRLKLEISESDIFVEDGSFIDTIESTSKYSDEYEDYLFNENRDVISNFYNYFYNLFKGKERFQLLLQILIHYVLITKNLNFKKAEFVKYAKSHGFTGAFVNKFLFVIRAYNKDFFVHDLQK